MLRAGVYALTSDMCSDGRLCLTQAVRIEAEVAGTVVLDAQQGNRVLYISGTEAELVGLNITGGYLVRSPDLNPRVAYSPLKPTLCAVFTRSALLVLAFEPSELSSSAP